MDEAELEYLCRVFKDISPEKQDCILVTARSLLDIQENNSHTVIKNSGTRQCNIGFLMFPLETKP